MDSSDKTKIKGLIISVIIAIVIILLANFVPPIFGYQIRRLPWSIEQFEIVPIQESSAGPVNETNCNDGLDDDNDRVPDCFDMDCNAECSALFEAGKVCCLDHDARTCRYTSNYSRDGCPMAAYPVLSEDVCKTGCSTFQYTYLG